MRRKEEERHSEVGHKKFGERQKGPLNLGLLLKEEDQKGPSQSDCRADDDCAARQDPFVNSADCGNWNLSQLLLANS